MYFKIFKAASIALLGALALAKPAMAETTLRVLTGWAPNVSYVAGILPKFEAAVVEATGGEVAFHNSGPEVVPPFEQLQPLSSGVFDLMYTTPAYHQAQTGVGTAIDGLLSTDIEALREAGVLDHVNDYYRSTFGVEILAYIPAPANQIILADPLQGDTLAGLKIRSNAAFEGMIRQLGGEPVSMSPTDAYAALQRGVLDGIAFPIHASADFRLYEVGNYMMRPAFGHSSLVLMANSGKLAALPENLQQAIREAALQMEREGAEHMHEIGRSQEAAMTENGVEAVEFAPAIADDLQRMFFEGTLAVARRSAPDKVDELLDLAAEKGLTSR